MLDDCKKYWQNHSTLVTCFADLRPFVESLEDIQDFVTFYNGTKVSGQVCIQFSTRPGALNTSCYAVSFPRQITYFN